MELKDNLELMVVTEKMAMLEILEKRVNKEKEALRELLVLLGLTDPLVPGEIRVNQDYLVKLVMLVLTLQMEKEELRDYKVLRESKEMLVRKESKEKRVILATLVNLDRWVVPVQRVWQAMLGKMEPLVHQARRALVGHRVRPAHKVIQDRWGHRDPKEILAPLVIVEQRAQKDYRDLLDHPDLPDLRALLEATLLVPC